MGRNSTGAVTVKEAVRIELSYLLKNGYIKKDCKIVGSLSWTNGSCISIETKYTENEKYIRLNYYNTKADTGEKKAFDYKIQLITVSSNLGKGEILYFVCPVTHKQCRILYKCYGSEYWISRTAYGKRIYYPQQISNKNAKHIERIAELEHRYESLKKPVKSHYRGKETRTAKKQKRLFELMEKEDDLLTMKLFMFFQKLSNRNLKKKANV